MSRKPLLILLALLAVLAFVLRRRRAGAPAVAPPAPSNGSPDDSREGLRRFVEAGERMHEGGQARSEL